MDWDIADYHAGHIPGAVGWVWSKDAVQAIRRDILDKAQLEGLLARAGIANDSPVIVYNGRSNLLATFVFWVLKVYGHGDVRLLDGGRKKWLDDGYPTSTDTPIMTPTSYKAHHPDWSLRAHRDLLLESIGKPDRILVDARPADMYSGADNAGTQRGGHIPHAVNIPTGIAIQHGAFQGWLIPTVQAGGTFKPFEALQTLYSSNGVTPDKEIITYCIVGELSSHHWFVLKYLLGYPEVRLYDGSWAEWGNLIGAPIEK